MLQTRRGRHPPGSPPHRGSAGDRRSVVRSGRLVVMVYRPVPVPYIGHGRPMRSASRVTA